MIVLPPAVVGVLSVGALFLLLAHRRANLGWRASALFVVSALAYGWARSKAIGWLSAEMGSDAPYQLGAPVLTVIGVPLQELVGWVSALALASYVADRLLRGFGRSANPWSTVLVAGVVMAATCLAVESAAVAAGWWSWTLGHSSTGALRFPAIALVDWGFVAFDFLLPFELWRRAAPVWQRLLGLLFFPLHFAGHGMTRPVSLALPVSGFELVHIGLIAFVAAAAMDRETSNSPWPATGAERLRFAAWLGAAVIIATTTTQLVLLQEWSQLWTALPLALLAGGACLRQVSPQPAQRESRSRRFAWTFSVLLGGGTLLRLPSAMQARDFQILVTSGAQSLSAGRLDAARGDLQAALRIRPAHADVHWLMGWLELRAGNRGPAREHLEAAVAGRLASVDAVRYLALLNLVENRPEDARALLARRRAQFPETADLAYLTWITDERLTPGGSRARGSLEPAPMVATVSGPMLTQIAALAQTLGDTVTLQACMRHAQGSHR